MNRPAVFATVMVVLGSVSSARAAPAEEHLRLSCPPSTQGRIIGLEVDLTAAVITAIRGLPPPGWSIQVNSDTGVNSKLGGSAYTGAATLFCRQLSAVEVSYVRTPMKGVAFSVKATADLTTNTDDGKTVVLRTSTSK